MAEEEGGVSTKGGLRGETSRTLPKSTRFSQPTQASTQTLTGEVGDNDITPSDPDDSDDEPAPSSSKGKAPEPRAHRRYTLEPGEAPEEIYITEEQDGEEAPQESIFARVRTVEGFTDSVNTHPEIWINTIRKVMTTLTAYQEASYEATQNLISNKERIASLTQQLKEKDQSLLTSRANEERLRVSRTTYRARSAKLREDVSELQAEADNLRMQLRTLEGQPPDGDPNSDPDDSDREGERPLRPPPPRRATAPLPSSTHPSRRGTPSAAATVTTSGAKSNNKYPDVKDFMGNNEDRDTWDSWKMHLKSKFMMSWELFETEVSKILYIRDHCKETAYNIIKAKADLDARDHYTTADEVIADLEAQFGDVDKEAKADAELQDPKSYMGAKDTKETFDAFHSRFTAMISPLDMSEREKCGHLRRMIASRLKYRILDYASSSSYRELVSRLRQVDLNLRLVDQQSPRGGRGGSSLNPRGGRGGSSSNLNPNTNSNSNSRGSSRSRGSSVIRKLLPEHVSNRLKKEGRCFKCLQPGHLPNESNAPCRDKEWLTNDQVTAQLAEAGIEQNSDAPPTYNQQLSEK